MPLLGLHGDLMKLLRMSLTEVSAVGFAHASREVTGKVVLGMTLGTASAGVFVAENPESGICLFLRGAESFAILVFGHSSFEFVVY
jgi:hypothetical protein